MYVRSIIECLHNDLSIIYYTCYFSRYDVKTSFQFIPSFTFLCRTQDKKKRNKILMIAHGRIMS